MTYVSDILEDLLDARATRQRVIDVVMALIDPLPENEARALRPVLAYYGGKCMGYPAIWCISVALELDVEAERGLIERVRATLFANLTTSIVDDLFDRDEQVSVEHLGVLYLLLYGALIAGEWDADFAPAAQAAFRQALRSARLRETGSADRDILRIRGARIGAFFGLTARACARVLELAPDVETQLVTLLEDFGSVCGHIDDLLDFEVDLSGGDHTNAVALALGARPDLDPAHYAVMLRSPRGRELARHFLEAEFALLVEQAEVAEWTGLAEHLRTAGANVFCSLVATERV